MQEDIYKNVNKPPQPHSGYITGAFICLALGVYFTITFLANVPINLGTKVSQETVKDYYVEHGTIGDFIAGTAGTLFSLAAFFLIYLTFKSQNDNFEHERIETSFFELLKLHKENISEFEIYEPVKGKAISTGRRVFEDIFHEVDAAYFTINIICKDFTITDILSDKTIEQINRNKNFENRDFPLIEFAKINISYSIVFFGVKRNNISMIKSLLYEEYDKNFIDGIFYFFSIIPHSSVKDKYRKWFNVSRDHNLMKDILKSLVIDKTRGFKLIDQFKNHQHFADLKSLVDDIQPYKAYFLGRQLILGHYYRNLYNIVNFIDGQDLNYEKKYAYIKILRTQLSNYEQIIFFFNSLSFMGRSWELQTNSFEFDPNKWLITKYNLIKNIPDIKLFDNVNIQKFYPDIDFEFETPSESRKKILNYFK